MPAQDASLKYTEIKAYFPVGSAFYDFSVANSVRYTNADSGLVLLVPFDGLTPLFLAEGKLLFTQFTHNANRARLLNNHFEIHAAIKKENEMYGSAMGNFLAINNYEDNNLIASCLGENDCGFHIALTMIVKDETAVYIQFHFSAHRSNTVFQ